jgi:hypothetical protein
MNKPENLKCSKSENCPFKDCKHHKNHSEFGGCMHVGCKAPGTDHAVCVEVKE